MIAHQQRLMPRSRADQESICAECARAVDCEVKPAAELQWVMVQCDSYVSCRNCEKRDHGGSKPGAKTKARSKL